MNEITITLGLGAIALAIAWFQVRSDRLARIRIAKQFARAWALEARVMANWTPGPWSKPDDGDYVVDASGETIFTGYDNENPNLNADLALAATAPDMAALLKMVADWLDRTQQFPMVYGTNRNCFPLHGAIVQVLAKAGRTPEKDRT